MSIQASLHGRIGTDPVTSTTAKGSDMARVSVAVNVAGWSAETDEICWVSVLAFGKVAETLARAEKGQMLTAQGKLTRGRYQAKDGTERESWTLTADAVLTLRSARPSGRKGAAPDRGAPRSERWARDGDELAF